MPNGEYSLPCGRTVKIRRLLLAHTFAGQLEGTPELVSPGIIQRLPKEAVRVLPPGKPLVVVKPDKLPLPNFRLIAELESPRGVRNTDPDFGSQLFVVWFTDKIDTSIDELISPVLSTLDWDRHAEDFDFTYV
jgi:hypothetical protein